MNYILLRGLYIYCTIFITLQDNCQNALFKYYPGLASNLSYLALGDFPTPVTQGKIPDSNKNQIKIYIKHDGLCGKIINQKTKLIGGNKLRKLQYLLADALKRNYDTVLTYGCVGSNHVLQTAVYAQEMGLKSISLLKYQPVTRLVQKNVLKLGQTNSQIYYAPTEEERVKLAESVIQRFKQETNKNIYVIPTGGSNPLGVIGYVEAAFELKEQIQAGLLPKPDYIYVPYGSGGTAAGLLLGCKAAGINAHIVMVSSASRNKTKIAKQIRDLFMQANKLLHTYDKHFALYDLEDTAYTINTGSTGLGYGYYTSQAARAQVCARQYAGIILEGVYTAKCFDALLADICADKYTQNTTLLFFNTYCCDTAADPANFADYTKLPTELHYYFNGSR